MSLLKQNLLRHLKSILGEQPDLIAKPAPTLPLFLRERYEIYFSRMFGHRYLLALETGEWDSGSPGEYGKHLEAIQSHLTDPVILVLPTVPAYNRNRLVQQGIPFIVPGNQIFIPNHLIDLRERQPSPNPLPRAWLSPAAQCTVLYHLLREPLGGIPLREIALKMKYSTMMATKVKAELKASDICRVVRNGRATVLEFATTGRQLWEQIKPKLRSPVRKTIWVGWTKTPPSALIAGMTALSHHTLITDDRLPTWALPQADLQGLLEQGIYTACHDAETAMAKMEGWSYDPQLLGNNLRVDPLSLYLSLQHSADERVQLQLEQLIAEVKW